MKENEWGKKGRGLGRDSKCVRGRGDSGVKATPISYVHLFGRRQKKRSLEERREREGGVASHSSSSLLFESKEKKKGLKRTKRKKGERWLLTSTLL